MKKKKIIGLGVLGFIVCCFGFLTLPKQVVCADVGAVIKDFQMEYGASVRIGTIDGKDGIRFTATMPTSVYETLEAMETDTISVSYGMFIIPDDYTQEESETYIAPLNEETLFGDNAKYTVTDCTPSVGDNTCTCEKRHVSHVESQTLSGTSEKKFLRGSIVDLKKGNRTRAFVGLGYVKYTQDGISEYFLAENAKSKDGTGEADIANNTRSMSYVAQLAIAEDKDDENDTLYTMYVQPFEDISYKYEVHHYLPDKSEWIVQTMYAPLGDEVTAKHLAKTEEYAQYSAYKLDEENQNAHMQDIVYANGKTILRCYYTKETTKIERTFNFATEADAKTYLADTAWGNIVPKISHLDSKDDRLGIAEYSTGTEWNRFVGGFFYINLSAYVDEIMQAFSDDTRTFSMQIDMFIYTSKMQAEGELILFQKYEINARSGVWQTITIDENMLKEFFTEEQEIRNIFEGEQFLFKIKDSILSKNEKVTYYVDCITYTVTEK